MTESQENVLGVLERLGEGREWEPCVWPRHAMPILVLVLMVVVVVVVGSSS